MPMTPPPTPPSREDPSNFSDRADAFLGWFPTHVAEIDAAMDDMDANVAAAQAAAAAAVSAPGTSATSTTSLTIGAGAQALTVQAGKSFVVGQWIAITHSANAANQMIGRIDSYDSGTGALAVTVYSTSGSGTAASWVIGLTPAFDTNALPKSGGTMTGAISEMGNGSTIKDPDGTARTVGYRTIPFRSATAQQTLAATDVGRCISITTGGIIVPTNAAVAFAIGDTISVYNNSGSNQTISAQGGVTLRLAGSSTTGSRTLAQRGFCTLMKVGTDEWIVTGAGVS